MTLITNTPGDLHSVSPGGGGGHFISGAEAGSPSAICHQRLQSPKRCRSQGPSMKGSSLHRHAQRLTEVNSHPKVEKGRAGELGRQGGGVEVEGTWRV